ncbi:TIM barrel protein [Methanococcus maripaludis]|uniref:Sugar phosphate isomerase/epimerase n=1 Tax=Methanococcus maripaludis TaxID=39152 RepID=A0A7J9PS55_METMI|nr:TIM barrel protein [Methanococcus maripaludis]MBA2868822.1 sugar phosphate isomerase/epimerase [Methanococcus maripaludis]
MYKLINVSNYKGDLEKFQHDHNNMGEFLKRNNLDGFELLQFGQWNEDEIPKNFIKGLHLRFYPTWIDFYRGDMDKLLLKVYSKENIVTLYGGTSKDVIIDYYKSELKTAKEMGVEYVVMHVCHVDLEDSLTYNANYTDEEVIDEAINLINEVFDEETDCKFHLLLENLWWPGLKLKNKENMRKLIDKINYEKVGFILDTGHMVNTNLEIKNENEAIEYIFETIENLGEMKDYIYGMHLNYSLSGNYVKEFIKTQKITKRTCELDELFKEVCEHIGKIDYHDPFEHEKIKELIESLNIKYLVYELFAPNLKDLEDKIKRQNKWVK